MNRVYVHKNYFMVGEAHYKLYASINHTGQLDSGHYEALVRDEPNQSWFKYADSTVKKMNADVVKREVGNENAYLLFYRRVN